MSLSTAKSSSRDSRPKATESMLLAMCAASFVAYLSLSVGIRAFVVEVVRLGGKFLG